VLQERLFHDLMPAALLHLGDYPLTRITCAFRFTPVAQDNNSGLHTISFVRKDEFFYHSLLQKSI